MPYSWAAVAYLLFLCFLAYRIVRPGKVNVHSVLKKGLEASQKNNIITA